MSVFIAQVYIYIYIMVIWYRGVLSFYLYTMSYMF